MSKKPYRSLAFPPLVLGARLPDPRETDEVAEGEAEPLILSTADAAELEPIAPSTQFAAPSSIDAMEAMLEPAAAPTEPAPIAGSHIGIADLEPLGPPKTAKARKVKPEKLKPEKIKKAKPGKDTLTPLGAVHTTEATGPAIAPSTPRGPTPTALPVWARWAYRSAMGLGVVWGALMITFSLAYQYRWGPFEYAPFPPAVFGALAVLPAAFMLIGAFVLRQAATLSLETRRARALAEDLAIPAALAADQAGGAADAVRREVARATEAGEAAERQLQALRQALAEESTRLIAATEDAERAARALTESLSRERAEMASLTAGLDQQVEAVNDAIDRQTRMVTQTSDLAATQLQEAEAILAARATNLAAAAGEAGEAADLASEALARQVDRLHSAGELVETRLAGLNDEFARGHSRLADLAVQLQADQEALSERLDAQRRSAAEAAADAAASAQSIAGEAETTAATLRDLIAEADQRLRSVADAVQSEQSALDARSRAALSLFRDAVAEERTTIAAETDAALGAMGEAARTARAAAAADLEAVERSVAAQAEAARASVEQLGEAAFAAAQKADQAFDARITAARRAIEQSAALIGEAGESSVGRIDASLAAARSALGEVEAMLTSVDQRVAALPNETRAHADAVKAAVQAGLDELSASARKIAGEAEAVDTALQERVRRNYEMLSEALKTMGKVAAVTEQAAAIRPAPLPVQPPVQAPVRAPMQAQPIAPTPPPAARPISAAATLAAAHADRAIRVPSAPAPAAHPAALASADIGLRPRLRLTAEQEAAILDTPAERLGRVDAARRPPEVHATLDAFQRPADRSAPPAREPAREAAWSWKDLLSSIDEPPIDDEVLAERLISEIEAMGLDTAHLLPLHRIDEIAAAVQRGDDESARETVRGLAPGAVRRLSRRVLTDKVLRAQADRYVRRYEDLLHDSARRDREGFMTAALLGSDPGRAFLLFNAAVGELH